MAKIIYILLLSYYYPFLPYSYHKWHTIVFLLKCNKLKNLKDLKWNLRKFKRNFTLFETLLTASPKKQTFIKDISEITFGNVNATLFWVISGDFDRVI